MVKLSMPHRRNRVIWELHVPGGATFRSSADHLADFPFDPAYTPTLEAAQQAHPSGRLVAVVLPGPNGKLVPYQFRWWRGDYNDAPPVPGRD